MDGLSVESLAGCCMRLYDSAFAVAFVEAPDGYDHLKVLEMPQATIQGSACLDVAML